DEYDPQSNSWSAKSSAGFTARWQASAAPGKDGGGNVLLFVFGGQRNLSPYLLSTVEAYNPVSDSWQTKSSMPAQAGNVKATRACNGLIYVFGSTGLSTDVWAYNPANDTWQPKAPMPLARDGFAVTTGRNGRIYVLGGGATGTGVCSTDIVDVYHPNTDTWNTYGWAPPSCTKRNDLAAASLGGKVYSIGGGNHGACGIYPETTIEGLGPIYWTFGCPFFEPIVVSKGHPHYALGDAKLDLVTGSTGQKSLVVSNIGSSGEDGVAIDIGEGTGVEVALEADGLKAGSSMDVAAIGMRDGVEDGTALVARVEHKGDSVELSASVVEPALPGVRLMPHRKTVSLYLRGALVSQQGDVTGDGVARVVPSAGTASIAIPKDIHIKFFPYTLLPEHIAFTWDGRLTGRPPAAEATVSLELAGQVVECDRVVVSFDDPSRLPGAISGAALTASNIGSIALTDESEVVEFAGQNHHSTGEATLAILAGVAVPRFLVSNIGSSGEDGVALDFTRSGGGGGGVDGFELAFDSTGVKGGSQMTLRAKGVIKNPNGGGMAGSLHVEHTGSGVDLSVSGFVPEGARAVPKTVHLYRGGEEVAKVGGILGAKVATLLVDPAAASIPWPKDIHISPGRWPPVEITFDGILTGRKKGGDPLEYRVEVQGQVLACDSLGISFDGVESLADALTEVALTASGLDEIQITDESTRVELQGLAHNTLGSAAVAVADLDGDGLPELELGNIGSSGEDGVRVDLGRGEGSSGFEVAFEAAGVRPGSQMRFISSDINGDVFEALAVHTGAAVDLAILTNEPGLPSEPRKKRVSAYRGGVRVAAGDFDGDGIARVVSPTGDPAHLTWPKDFHIWINPHGGGIDFTWSGKLGSARTGAGAQPADAAIAARAGESEASFALVELAGQVVECDTLAVAFEDPAVLSQRLAEIAFKASNLDRIRITDESVRVDFGGLDHGTLGSARLTAADLTGDGIPDLQVSNIGSSGQDGVAVDLDPREPDDAAAAGFEVAFEAAGVREGSQMRFQTRNAAKGINSPNLLVRIAHTGPALELELVNDSPRKRVSLRKGGVIVASGDVTGDGVARVVSTAGDPVELASYWPKDVHIDWSDWPRVYVKFTFSGILGAARGAGGGAGTGPEIPVELGGGVHLCDTVEVQYEDASSSPPVFGGVDLTAANLDSFTITDENVIPAAPPAPGFRRGDSNGDGAVDIGDAIFTLGFLFLGGKDPACLDAADANDTGALDLSDAVFGLNYLFLGGKTPPSPGPDACGPDPTDDGLGCGSYERC
ncbi:MAG: hypothetical protein HY721_24440, partial [Planctomycetes bacterium]|nr:hypothetical protein [Planctomycetota bacterium]